MWLLSVCCKLDCFFVTNLFIKGLNSKSVSVENCKPMFQLKSGFKSIYINCTSMRSSSSVYARMAEHLKLKATGRNEKDLVAQIEKRLEESQKMM